ncbi:MAG: response regulator [Thiotrichales bacterium]
MNQKLKVLIIDDHTLFREGLQGLLKHRNIEVVASVGDGRDGIRLADELVPDVILLDMRMPDIDGLGVLRALRQRGLQTPVAILTTSSNEKDLVDALRSGAQGYLLKDMEPDQLVVALYDIVAGKMIVAPALTQVLAKVVQGETITPEPSKPIDTLTPREAEILSLLADGLSNKVIAKHLGISDGTVKLHVKAILRKLDVHSRVEAAVIAVEHGFRSNLVAGGAVNGASTSLD